MQQNSSVLVKVPIHAREGDFSGNDVILLHLLQNGEIVDYRWVNFGGNFGSQIPDHEHLPTYSGTMSCSDGTMVTFWSCPGCPCVWFCEHPSERGGLK